jgi:hypothetical protein
LKFLPPQTWQGLLESFGMTTLWIMRYRLRCLFETHISLITQSFEQASWVELNQKGIIIQGQGKNP